METGLLRGRCGIACVCVCEQRSYIVFVEIGLQRGRCGSFKEADAVLLVCVAVFRDPLCLAARFAITTWTGLCRPTVSRTPLGTLVGTTWRSDGEVSR